ncbi:F5/8 type C domain [Phytophthora infestans]|uniref:F5/8 type C domain n=1 Tax=Phytophthora infestans TaxID=4787 RepID=A0A833WMF7_PHYIN|nr:F5/8 type C domain [Phytophthora infestans]KAF4137864.1 F5/8 type C domain [Phytophthora infestans]
MTVSSSSEATINAAPMASVLTDASADASILRNFALILCSECQYLEFPGCDLHGALYTQQLTDPDGKLHAKCPSCTAATNNARPFRDGCRRCKSPTIVSMWSCSLQEIQQAIDAFPVSAEEIEHTVINCERCLSVIFPRAREVLTTRSALELLAAASGKPLKVANFQLSMPHVDGCLRKGMPLQAVAVQLPKSELKFVVDRISRCPLAPKMTGKPQYRPRKVELVTQQNHLQQVAIRLLSTVIDAFDADSPVVAQPLRQVVAVLGKMGPLALFSEWSPPRQLSAEKVFPKEVTASSVFDEQHAASKILESDSSFWRSASKTDYQSAQSNEWIVCQFGSAVSLSCVELKWRADFVPESFSLSISTDGMSYETVAIVTDRITDNRILVPKGTLVASIKITMFSSGVVGETFGLEAIVCQEAAFSSVHTSPDVMLRSIQQWLFDAAVSSLPEIRDLALQALQKLLLASGSLCGLLQLATCLVLNTHVTATTATADFDRQDYDRLDLLSEDGKKSARVFMKELATSIQRIMIGNHSHGRVLDQQLIEQVFLMHEEGDSSSNKEATNGGLSASLVTLLVGRHQFLNSVERRSQLGMIILHMLSELSAWQMKRMQKAEELTGKKELELMQLEEPFSIEICPDFFAISHRLLVSILSRWLPSVQEQAKSEGKGSDAVFNGDHGTEDVYDALASSCVRFCSDADLLGSQSGVDSSLELPNGASSGHSKFSPDGLCVAVLEIITSNLRRLVLSRIDPFEIGITPALVRSEGDLLSAPPALNPTVTSLEQLISLGTKRSDAFFPVSLKAAAAMEVGTEAFYPSSHQRTKVLASRMGKGATLEVQVRWPVQERDQEDPRYERLILMLQMECIKLGIRHAIRGSWYFFMHLVVEVPSTRDTEEVLTQHFASCIQRAGFSSWQVAAGAQELSINLQRHLHWNRVEKMSQDSGAGWIRVYPADVAAYDEVLTDVEGFLAEHGKYKTTMARP